jgi:hypothetical protein
MAGGGGAFAAEAGVVSFAAEAGVVSFAAEAGVVFPSAPPLAVPPAPPAGGCSFELVPESQLQVNVTAAHATITLDNDSNIRMTQFSTKRLSHRRSAALIPRPRGGILCTRGDSGVYRSAAIFVRIRDARH